MPERAQTSFAANIGNNDLHLTHSMGAAVFELVFDPLTFKVEHKLDILKMYPNTRNEDDASRQFSSWSMDWKYMKVAVNADHCYLLSITSRFQSLSAF